MNYDPPAEPPVRSGALIRPFLGAGLPVEDRSVAAEPGPALRPFLLTSGRVRADASIAIETQVVSTELGHAAAGTLVFERRHIVDLCAEPQSVAEIAAALRLHLSVVRILVGDLAGEGHLAVYLPNAEASSDVDTLLRVIRGLRAIS